MASWLYGRCDQDGCGDLDVVKADDVVIAVEPLPAYLDVAVTCVVILPGLGVCGDVQGHAPRAFDVDVGGHGADDVDEGSQ